MVIFVTGGVRSGKSAFAENYIQSIKGSRQAIYIASGVAFDDEMKKRIERHQYDRQHDHWLTYEVETIFPPAFETFGQAHIILWDCLTTWLTNVLVAELPVEEMITLLKQQLVQWRRNGVTVIFVSNEVLDAGVSKYEWTANYQRLLGQLNTWLVQFCDEAYECDYSVVKRWKG